MMARVTLFCAVLCAGAYVPAAHAQDRLRTATAATVAEELFLAVDRLDWSKAAGLISLAAAQEFKDAQLQAVRGDSASEISATLLGIAGVANSSELLALDARVLLERAMASGEPREALIRALRESGSDASEEDAIRSPWLDRSVVGALPEDDSTVHVLYRMRSRLPGSIPDTSLGVLTFYPEDGLWRVLRVEGTDPVLGILRPDPYKRDEPRTKADRSLSR